MNKNRMMLSLATAALAATPLTSMAAYNSPDPSFGQNGLVTITYPAAEGGSPHSMQEIAASGHIYVMAENPATLVRLTSAGEVDTTFGTNGFMMFAEDSGAASDDGVFTVDESGGYAYLAYIVPYNGCATSGSGCAQQALTIRRFSLSTGALDTSYGTDGIATLASTAQTVAGDIGGTDALLLQPDGKLIVAGDGSTSNSGDSNEIFVTRLLSSGATDSQFASSNSNVVTTSDLRFVEPGGISLDASGKIVVADETSIVRLTSAGALDTTFGSTGTVTNASFSALNLPFTKADGTVVIQGKSGSDYSLLEYTSTGAPLTSFGTNGVQAEGTLSTNSSFALQQDGKILAADDTGTAAVTVARYQGSPEYVSPAPSGSGSTATVPSHGSFGTAVLASNTGTINNAQSVDQPAGAPSDYQYPDGWFSYNISGIPNGSSVTLTMTLPAGSSPNAYVKCDNAGQCSLLPTASFSGNKVTLKLTDGGAGDADGVANGTIIDPGAPAIVPTSSGGGGALGWLTLLPLFGLFAMRRRFGTA